MTFKFFFFFFFFLYFYKKKKKKSNRKLMQIYPIFLQPTNLLLERLRAWKHLCGTFEIYVSASAKVQKAQAKDYEKILKVRIELHLFLSGLD